LLDRDGLERLGGLAAGLGGRRLLYLDAPPGESGDPGASLVPLLRDLGLEAERAMLHGDADLADLARGLGDAVRGAEWPFSAARWDEYREPCEAAAVAFDLRGIPT
jgi:hypothetical protein